MNDTADDQPDRELLFLQEMAEEHATIAGDVAEMRGAIAQEKGDANRWDLKYAAGGLIDLEFIAQYLQLVHAAEHTQILDTNTARVLDKAWRLGLLKTEDAGLKLTATNLEIGITYWVPGKIETDGATTVPAKLLTDLVNSLPAGDRIDLALQTGDTLHLKSGRFETHIKGIDADEFPAIGAAGDGHYR